jgi:hypothetical protein
MADYAICDDCVVGCHKCRGEWLDVFGTGESPPDPMPRCDCGEAKHQSERILGFIEGLWSRWRDNPTGPNVTHKPQPS